MPGQPSLEEESPSDSDFDEDVERQQGGKARKRARGGKILVRFIFIQSYAFQRPKCIKARR